MYHLQILPCDSTGTLLASPSGPHSITRGPEQCVASNNSSPPHPTSHLHHTGRHRQVHTLFSFISNRWLFHLAGGFAGCFISLFSNHHMFPSLLALLVMKQRMACHRVTPRWVRRVQASPCTPPSPRARGESPSSTAPTRTTTCRPRRFHVTPPSPVKGETWQARHKKND